MCQCPDGLIEGCDFDFTHLYVQETRDGNPIKKTIFYKDGSAESKPIEIKEYNMGIQPYSPHHWFDKDGFPLAAIDDDLQDEYRLY